MHHYSLKEDQHLCYLKLYLHHYKDNLLTIFKIYEKELDFKDVEIQAFQPDAEHGSFWARTQKGDQYKSFKINFLEFDDDVLTYTLT